MMQEAAELGDTAATQAELAVAVAAASSVSPEQALTPGRSSPVTHMPCRCSEELTATELNSC